MKKQILASMLLAASLLASQLCMTAHAAEEDILLISPRPAVAENTAAVDTEALLRSQYEKLAGMYAYDGVAAQLYSIGVLLGDGVNFNLDQIPDRQQACVMVVRMRGEEAAARAAYEAGEITCPFTDVTDEWVKPYLAWLYEKKITLGVGGGRFGNAVCTAQEYVTFMLRALGYTVTWDAGEDTDVLYADALDFARSIHLWDTCLACEPVFHRGVMSAVTYQTLAAEIKDGDDRLLSVLAKAGAVDAERAQPILDLYDKVDMAAAAELASVPDSDSGMKAAGTLEHDEYHIVSALGAPEDARTTTVYSGMTFDFGLDFTGGKQAFSLNGETTTQVSGVGMTIPMGMWLSDGMVYFDVMGQMQKADLAAIGEPDSLTSTFGDLSLLLEDTESRYYAVSEVYQEALDGIGTMIVYDTTDFMWPIIAAQLETEALSGDAALSVLVSTEKYIGEDGVLAGVYNGLYAGVTETDPQTAVTYCTEALIESTVTYTAWGDDVTLHFPDFSQFEEIAAERSGS